MTRVDDYLTANEFIDETTARVVTITSSGIRHLQKI